MQRKILFISEAQLKEQSVIEQNANAKVLSKIIHTVQELKLRPILGKELYNVLIDAVYNNVTSSTPYADVHKELLADYIQPYLVYATLADFTVLNNYKVSDKGVMKLTDNAAQSAQASEIEYAKDYYDNYATQYKQMLIDFLTDNDMLDDEADTDTTSSATGWFLEGNRSDFFTLTSPAGQTTSGEVDPIWLADKVYYYTKEQSDVRYAFKDHTHAYSELTGIPSTFTPSAHTHPISDVVDLQSELDAKALKSSTITINGVTYDLSASRTWTLTTSDIAEGTNLYYTDARTRAALSAGTGIAYDSTTGVISSTITQYTDAMAKASISLTTTGTSGAATYNSTTGVFNVPNYTLTGLGGAPSTRTITINGTAQDLSADRTWTLTTSVIAEGSNLYYTDARARAAISLTTTGASGAATYNSTTGVLNIPVYTAAGLGAPTGSGTANYLVRWLTSSTQGIGATQDDGTNVGIGTAPTAYKLEVNGSFRAGVTVIGTNNSGVGLTVGTGTRNVQVYNGTSYNQIYSSHDLEVFTNNASSAVSAFRIFNTGNIVVNSSGTDSGQKLQVEGNTKIGSLRTHVHSIYGALTVGNGGTGSDVSAFTVLSMGNGASDVIRVRNVNNNGNLFSIAENGYFQIGTNYITPTNGLNSLNMRALTPTAGGQSVKIEGYSNNGNLVYRALSVGDYGLASLATGNFDTRFVEINPTINATSGGSYTLRGFYYNPTVTALTATTLNHTAFENVVGNNYFNSTSGVTNIGYTSGATSTAAKLNVKNTTASGVSAYFEMTHAAGGTPYIKFKPAAAGVASATAIEMASVDAMQVVGNEVRIAGNQLMANGSQGVTATPQFYLASTASPLGNNNSFLRMIVSNSNEFSLTGANYLSGVNYFVLGTYLNAPITATNTGTTAIRAPLYIDGRQLRFFTGNAVPSYTTTPAWMISEAGNLVGGSTTDSGYKLDVAGTLRVQSVLYTNGIQFQANSAVLDLEGGAVSMNRITINTSGGWGGWFWRDSSGAKAFTIGTSTVGTEYSMGIGVTMTNQRAVVESSAQLEIKSTTKGFLPPRMTTAQRTAIVSPAEGLIVYDTDTHKSYTFDGTAWQAHF